MRPMLTLLILQTDWCLHTRHTLRLALLQAHTNPRFQTVGTSGSVQKSSKAQIVISQVNTSYLIEFLCFPPPIRARTV